MKITYAVTTHNEGKCINLLLDQLIPLVDDGHQVIILDDYSTDKDTLDILDRVSNVCGIPVHKHALNNDFAEHKNQISEYAEGEFIFQIDADELLSDNLLHHLEDVLIMNPAMMMVAVPRVNIVNGLTMNDITAWRWAVNDQGWVMWPDYQTRIYRNSKFIKWKNKVHETLTYTGPGSWEVSQLPAEEEWALRHTKTIERQRKQNAFYDTLV